MAGQERHIIVLDKNLPTPASGLDLADPAGKTGLNLCELQAIGQIASDFRAGHFRQRRVPAIGKRMLQTQTADPVRRFQQDRRKSQSGEPHRAGHARRTGSHYHDIKNIFFIHNRETPLLQ